MEKNSKPNPNPRPQSSKEFVIPQRFFNQLNEFSNGGFYLILTGADGQPKVFSKCDNAVIALGLRKIALDYFKGVNSLDTENVLDAIDPFCNDDDDDEDDGDDEEDAPNDDDTPPEPQKVLP